MVNIKLLVLTLVRAHGKCSKERKEGKDGGERKRMRKEGRWMDMEHYSVLFCIGSHLCLLSNHHNLPYSKRLVSDSHYRSD